mgnify:CR=1 FL=1
MTHIQSIFDLCPDIQERIGKELAPLVKSKKLKIASIHQCKDLMNEYDMPKLEDLSLSCDRFPYGYQKCHIGRMLLYLLKSKLIAETTPRQWNRWQERVLTPKVFEILHHLMPELTRLRLTIADALQGFQCRIQKGEEINIYGLKWKTFFLKDGNVVSKYQERDRRGVLQEKSVIKFYTSKQLDEIAEPLEIKKWRKHWKKNQKIQCLIETEV